MLQILITKPNGTKHFAGIGTKKDLLQINALAADKDKMTIQTVEADEKGNVKEIIETHTEAQAVVHRKEKDSLLDENRRLKEALAELQNNKASSKKSEDDADSKKSDSAKKSSKEKDK